jgi:heat shock protein HtpX
VLALLPIAALPSVLFFGEYLMVWMALPLAALLGVLIKGESNIALFFVADAIVAVVTMLAAMVLAYTTASRRVLRSLSAKPLAPAAERQFEQVVENMAIASGLPRPALFVIETDAANLAAVGLSPQSSSLIASRGVLQLLDRVELEAAVAHAMSQIGNHDTRLLTVLAAGTEWLRLPQKLAARVLRGLASIASRAGLAGWGCLIALALWLGLPMLLGLHWGLTDPDLRPLVVLALVVSWYVFWGAPLAALLIARFTSRERKYLADADAALLTRNPGALARALAKIDQVGTSYHQASGETAALHLVDPLPPGARWLDRAFDTHPPIQERVDVVRRLGGTVSDAEVLRAVEEARAALSARRQGGVPPEHPPEPDTASVTSLDTRVEAIELRDGGAALLASPHAGAREIAWLGAGTRLMVTSERGEYLAVITPHDQFGFIARTAPFNPLDLDDWLRP